MAKRTLAAILFAIASTACSQSPTVPETSAPTAVQTASFEGVWTINYTLEGCTGYRHCVDFKGHTETVYLHLARVGDEYEGVADVGLHVSVAGRVGPDGALKLTGRRTAAMPDDFDVEIDAISIDKTSLSAAKATGAIRYITKGQSNSSFFGNATKQGPITSIVRTGTIDSASSLPGTWTGIVAVRTCEATGWTHCYPLWEDETSPVMLSLAPGAGGVEGILKFSGASIPVTGSAAGGSIRLSGTHSHVSSGVTVTYVVDAARLTVDRVGRLTGDVTMVSSYNWHDGRGTWTVRYPPMPLHAAGRSLR